MDRENYWGKKNQPKALYSRISINKNTVRMCKDHPSQVASVTSLFSLRCKADYMHRRKIYHSLINSFKQNYYFLFLISSVWNPDTSWVSESFNIVFNGWKIYFYEIYSVCPRNIYLMILSSLLSSLRSVDDRVREFYLHIADEELLQ